MCPDSFCRFLVTCLYIFRHFVAKITVIGRDEQQQGPLRRLDGRPGVVDVGVRKHLRTSSGRRDRQGSWGFGPALGSQALGSQAGKAGSQGKPFEKTVHFWGVPFFGGPI